MNYLLEEARQIPATEADVLVVGGGTSGCIAALAAARFGAKTVLIERHAVLGGTFTNGGNSVNSFYNTTDHPDKAIRIVGGLPYEMIQRMIREGAAEDFRPTAKDSHRVPYRCSSVNSEMYKGIMAKMLEEAGVHVMLQTYFCDVVAKGTVIKAAIIQNKDGRSAIFAKEYVDCSGDGDVARFTGVHMIENWEHYDCGCSSTGMVFALGGVDLNRTAEEGGPAMRSKRSADGQVVSVQFCYVDDSKYQRFTDMLEWYWMNIRAMEEHSDVVYVAYYTGPKTNCSSAENYSQAELHERIKIVDMVRAFRDTVPGFERCFPVWSATQLGIRASLAADCDKILSEEEIEHAARFNDEIGLYGYHDLSARDIEFQDRPKARFPHCMVGQPGYYGMPYRMLLPKGCDNLFMAGRCVTVDVEAHMSTRNTVGCMIMGQGAGTAAAICAEKRYKSRELPYAELRESLLKQGAILSL